MADDKPAILQETRFIVEEGWPYRILRGASIQLNRLMFSSLILLLLWVVWAAATGQSQCEPIVQVGADGQDTGTKLHCSVLLHPTTVFLAGAAFVSFVLSILLGLLGLVVGKRILEATPVDEEVGARRNVEGGTGTDASYAPPGSPDGTDDGQGPPAAQRMGGNRQE